MKYVNYFIQVFFIRLTRCEQRVITEFKLDSISYRGSVSGEIKNYRDEFWYSIQYWIIPFSGWSGEFKFIGNGKANFVRITKIFTA